MKLSYDKIAYNIENIPETEKCIEHFPDLMTQAHVFEADDVPEGVSTDKVLRYLIYMFAPHTPVRDAFPSIDKRKKYVLNKLNILGDEENEINEGYSDMCLMKSSWIILRFLAFTRLQKSEDYGIMATAELRMAELQKALLTVGIDKSTDDTNYQKGLEGWRVQMVAARDRIMAGESSLVLQQSITFSVRADTLGISIEEVARVFREKGEVFNEIIP